MKIDNTTPVSRPLATEQGKASGRPAATEGSTTQPAAIAHISQAATDTSRDIDAVKVNQIRQAISEGRLEINTERIADSLIDSLRTLLENDNP
ncbi:MAG TPA: flagellar biosynthesis anti-sigma factor FlgM [Porticoccaceae bacterium]